jgi:hypothetical protein
VRAGGLRPHICAGGDVSGIFLSAPRPSPFLPLFTQVPRREIL